MAKDQIVAAGESAYYNMSFGDYTAVAPSLSSSGVTMWFAGEYLGKPKYDGQFTDDWATKFGFSFWQN